MKLQVMVLAILSCFWFACGDDEGPKLLPDASTQPKPDAGVLPDAAQVACTSATYSAGTVLSTGADANFYGVGPGSWVGQSETATTPAAIFYVEAYANFIAGTTIDYTGFKNWFSECDACVFFGTDCATIEIPLTQSGLPTAPTQCNTLYMLDRGVVTLTAFDTDPAVTGSLTGTVTPRTGETSVRMVEVYRQGDPSTATGFGNMVPGGACLEVPDFSFSGTW